MKYEYIPRDRPLYLRVYKPRKEVKENGFINTLGVFAFVSMFFLAITIFGAAF